MIKRAMIMGAGLGTRMRPLTDDRPKPLVMVAGRTLIDHSIDRLVAAGVIEIVVNIHYKAAMLVAHLDKRRDVTVIWSDETEQLLDTGGGVVKALRHFQDEPFFVLNSDSIWVETGTPVLSSMQQAWDGARMDALLLLAQMDTAMGYDGAGDFVLLDDKTIARAKGRSEKPYAYPGVQIVHPRLFDGAPSGGFSTNRMWDVAIKKRRLYGMRLDGVWIHVGTPDAVTEAEEFLADRALAV